MFLFTLPQLTSHHLFLYFYFFPKICTILYIHRFFPILITGISVSISVVNIRNSFQSSLIILVITYGKELFYSVCEYLVMLISVEKKISHSKKQKLLLFSPYCTYSCLEIHCVVIPQKEREAFGHGIKTTGD